MAEGGPVILLIEDEPLVRSAVAEMRKRIVTILGESVEGGAP